MLDDYALLDVGGVEKSLPSVDDCKSSADEVDSKSSADEVEAGTDDMVEHESVKEDLSQSDVDSRPTADPLSPQFQLADPLSPQSQLADPLSPQAQLPEVPVPMPRRRKTASTLCPADNKDDEVKLRVEVDSGKHKRRAPKRPQVLPQYRPRGTMYGMAPVM